MQIFGYVCQRAAACYSCDDLLLLRPNIEFLFEFSKKTRDNPKPRNCCKLLLYAARVQTWSYLTFFQTFYISVSTFDKCKSDWYIYKSDKNKYKSDRSKYKWWLNKYKYDKQIYKCVAHLYNYDSYIYNCGNNKYK